jgi:hypothetical protein
MPLFSKIKSTFHSLLRKHDLDQDLDEELQSYLELLTQEKIGSGLDPDVARREARLVAHSPRGKQKQGPGAPSARAFFLSALVRIEDGLA